MTVTIPPDWHLRSRLKARQLALLVALAERRSLRRAAADVAVSQPAATKLLRDLEDTLGVPLFERYSWGMEPTIFGETMVRYARGMLTDLAEVRDELAALASGARGKLRVGTVTGAVPSLLVPALSAVRRAAPGVRIYVLVNSNEVLAAGLRQGNLDVAIGGLPGHEDAAAFTIEPLADVPLCVVARPGHGIRRSRTGFPAALATGAWILPPTDNTLRRSVEQFFTQANRRMPADLIETDSIVATLALLQQRDMFSVFPLDLAKHYEARRMLARVDVELPSGDITYALITRTNRRLSPAAQSFADTLRAGSSTRGL